MRLSTEIHNLHSISSIKSYIRICCMRLRLLNEYPSRFAEVKARESCGIQINSASQARATCTYSTYIGEVKEY